MAITEEMLGDRVGDVDVRYTPGAHLADHLDRPGSLTRSLSVMPHRVTLELLGITELLLASLTEIHEPF